MALFASSGSGQQANQYSESPQYQEGKFRNLIQDSTKMTLADTWTVLKRYLSEKSRESQPRQSIPVKALTAEQLQQDQDQGESIYRLGHSSLLLSLADEFWLIDPVLGERASPFRWVGPKRFHQAPIHATDLPAIKGVIISHNHYDHLDQSTIIELKEMVETFVVPLGVGAHLKEWGVQESQIVELDWWGSHQAGQLNLTATPAQHFSGRWLNDRDKTLWASWVIQTPEHKLFFSGDSGYFEGFKEIGRRYGPFDLSIMENGAYDISWQNIHMTPEQSLQAHLDIGAEAMLPIHNSTFDLALHAWYAPLEELYKLSQHHGVHLLTPMIGQRIALGSPDISTNWWNESASDPATYTQAQLSRQDLN